MTGLLADQLDQPTLKWGHAFFSGVRAQIAGDTDKVEQLATEALQIGTDGGEPDAPVYYGAHLAQASWQRGTMGERVPLIEQMAADNPGLPTLHAMLALAYIDGDRRADARHLLEEFAAADFDLPLDPVWLPGMVGYAEAAIECRDLRCAGPLFDRLAPWADRLATDGGATADGPVSHYLGGLATVLGRYDEADAYFAQAAAFSERADAKFFAARTNLSWGKMLAERRAPGDAERAWELLTRARTAAAAHGYANVERRAAEALQETD